MEDHPLLPLISSGSPPPFIYLHHPHTPPSLSIRSTSLDTSTEIKLDTIEYYTPKLIYSGILYHFCRSLGKPHDECEVSTWDGLSRALRELYHPVNNEGDKKGKTKSASKSNVNIPNGINKTSRNSWIISIKHAERLPRILGQQWPAITRMAELVNLPICVILASKTPWDSLRPPFADAPEPIHLYIPAPTKTDLNSQLMDTTSNESRSKHPLFPHFLNLFFNTIFPLISSNIKECDYLITPLWKVYTSTLPPHKEQSLLSDPSTVESNDYPPIEITVKMLTDLKYKMSTPIQLAIEFLIPRHVGPTEFVSHLTSRSTSLTIKSDNLLKLPSLESNLSLLARYLVVCGYLASQNPPKSDLRLFGRGIGMDGKRKRGGGFFRRSGYGKVKAGKVPQRLLGPKPFPIDRLLAIFQSLYAEHAERPSDLTAAFGETYEDGYDSSSSSSSSSSSLGSDREMRKVNGHTETIGSSGKKKGKGKEGSNLSDLIERQKAKVERKRKRDQKMEDRWQEEVEGLSMSVKFWSLIPELESQGIFRRISPPDRLDNIILRCEADYEESKVIARGLGFALDEYLYEATL